MEVWRAVPELVSAGTAVLIGRGIAFRSDLTGQEKSDSQLASFRLPLAGWTDYL